MPATPDDPNATRSQSPTHDPARTADHAATRPVPPPEATPTLPLGSAPDVPDVAATVASRAAVARSGVSALPGFEITGELGRGAMGVVYDARQSALNRRVALKVVRDASPDSLALVRFLAEAEVVAAVRHPNVVQVYESGQHAGTPYIAMEYLPGGTLADYLQGGARRGPGGVARLRPRDAAALVGKIARGVGAAHDLGIVHRDLKPGNVLFDAGREPKVADFGLAKRQAVDLTATQALMGTPAYMAPEQAGRRAKFLGPPADVWALGVILYECLAGARPFVGATTIELLGRIATDEPPALHSVRADVPRDLVTVIDKCLAKEPERRYATAGELADDLERFTRGEPIAARPAGRFERVVLWARRKPAVAGMYAMTGLAVLLIAFAGVAAWLWRDAETARGVAEEERGSAVRARSLAEQEKANADAARLRTEDALGREQLALAGEKQARDGERQAREELEAQSAARTVDVAFRRYTSNWAVEPVRQVLGTVRPDLRRWEWDYLNRLCDRQLGLIPRFESGAEQEAVSASEGAAYSAAATGVMRFDLQTGESARVPRAAAKDIGSVTHIAVSGDGKRLACCHTDFGGDDTITEVIDTTTGTILFTKSTKDLFGAPVAISGNGKRVAHSDPRAGQATLRDLDTGTDLVTLRLDGHFISSVAVDGRGRCAAVAGQRTVARRSVTLAKVWIEGRPDVLTIELGGTSPGVALSSDGTMLAVEGEWGGAVLLYQLPGGELVGTLKGSEDTAVTKLAFDAAGDRLAVAHDGGALRVWDVRRNLELATFRQPDPCTGVGFGAGCVVHVGTSRIRTWDMKPPLRVIPAWDPGRELLQALPPFNLGRAVLHGLPQGPLAVDDFEAGANVLAVAPGGRAAFWSGSSAPIQRIDAGSGRVTSWPVVTGPARGPRVELVQVTATPDGRRLTGLTTTGELHGWAVRDGGGIEHTGRIRKVAVDGIVGASADLTRFVRLEDNQVRVCDASGAVIWLPPERHFLIGDPVLSPDGRRIILSDSLKSAAEVWTIDGGAEPVLLRGVLAQTRFAFTPDGKRIASSAGSSVILWDAQTGDRLTSLPTAGAGIMGVGFSDDGSVLAAVDVAGNLFWYDSRPVPMAPPPRPAEP